MAFENVNVSSLRSALSSCKDSLNCNTTTELINSIADANVWDTDSKKTLKEALEKLANEKYKNLKDKLDSYSSIVTKIEEYQKLAEENMQLEMKYQRLREQSASTPAPTPTPSPAPTPEPGNTGSLPSNTSSSSNSEEMEEIMNKIKMNKQSMKSIENEVSNLI